MPSFVHLPLLWGLLLVGLPLLIHLINMVRHHRVQWAAMEFLLASQKRNRTWVLLKQLLLLALRMAMIAGVVFLVAQPRLRSKWAEWFGGTTHHIVLLDDSFSMSDRWQDTSAFDQAKSAVQRIADEVGHVGSQKFTLLRFSQTGRPGHGTQPDLYEESIDADFASRLRDLIAPMKPSQTAIGPTAAMDSISQLLQETAADQRVVYVVSDFRAREWNDPSSLRKEFEELNQTDTQLYLIDCVDSARPNLAITQLVPGSETRAAGTFFFMEVTVQNFGESPVKDVTILVEADGQAQPAVRAPSIPPRSAVKERFPLRFVTAGEHRVTARLEPDAVAADNFRCAIVEVPLSLPVLLIDGDSHAEDARYLNSVFAPGGTVVTGISPRIENPRYLSTNPLEQFSAIILTNVDRLDESAVTALDQYVKNGGGVAFFLGERVQSDFYNKQLYRDGQGFFPLPIGRPSRLFVDYLQKAPDLEVTQHPIFQVFAGSRNSFLPLVNVTQYASVPKTWRVEADPAVQVIARLRDGAPLAAERRFGRGRVVAFLTTAAPTWNNWARGNPSFVVAMLQLQAYLAQQPLGDVSRAVGAPLETTLDPGQYETQVRFTTPEDTASLTTTTDAVLGTDGKLHAVLESADYSGIYEVKVRRKDGREETRQWAFNVEPEEGDLKAISGEDLAARLKDVRYQYFAAGAFQYTSGDRSGYDLATPLMYLLILMLVVEQILAWSASYHPRSIQRGLAAGGVQ